MLISKIMVTGSYLYSVESSKRLQKQKLLGYQKQTNKKSILTLKNKFISEILLELAMTTN